MVLLGFCKKFFSPCVLASKAQLLATEAPGFWSGEVEVISVALSTMSPRGQKHIFTLASTSSEFLSTAV